MHVKHFLVIRDENKQNREVLEFRSFEEAKSEKVRRLNFGHKGELVLGQGETKEGFLACFSEYQTTE